MFDMNPVFIQTASQKLVSNCLVGHGNKVVMLAVPTVNLVQSVPSSFNFYSRDSEFEVSLHLIPLVLIASDHYKISF